MTSGYLPGPVGAGDLVAELALIAAASGAQLKSFGCRVGDDGTIYVDIGWCGRLTAARRR